jgi:hypothetical protein
MEKDLDDFLIQICNGTYFDYSVTLFEFYSFSDFNDRFDGTLVRTKEYFEKWVGFETPNTPYVIVDTGICLITKKKNKINDSLIFFF